MNDDQIGGKWDKASGKIKEKWGKLTDDELMEAKGNRQNLVGRIQERYGDAKEKIEKELDKILSKI